MSVLNAQTNLVSIYEEDNQIINPTYLYKVDTTNTLNFESIQTISYNKFKINNGLLNLGVCDKPIWLKFKFYNKNSNLNSWILRFNFSLLDTIIVFHRAPNGQNKMILGELVPTYYRYYESNNVCFPLNLPFDQEVTMYVKVKTSGGLYLPISIFSEKRMLEFDKNFNLLYGFFYGAVFLILFYNFTMFFIVKDKLYILYCLYVILVVAIVSYFNGHVSYFPIFNSHREHLNLFIAITIFSFISVGAYFTIQFLDVEKISNRLKNVLYFFMGVGIFSTILSFFIPHKITTLYGSVLCIITPLLYLGTGVYVWIRGNKIARFYILSSLILLLSIISLSIRMLGITNGVDNQDIIIELGVILNALMMAIALADRFKILRTEIINNKQYELNLITEKERIVFNQNIVLENKIEERTKEIINKNEQLELYSKTIEQQNKVLQDYSLNLEKQIEQRTTEIVKANKLLERKTDRLEQFTYIVSHNLKSPVNNLESILTLIDMNDLNEENKEYIEVLQKIESQLKHTIEDINILVKIDKEKEISFVDIDLIQVIENVKESLLVQIEALSVNIKTDLQVNNIKSFGPYLNSIIYNLINNAIKYKSENRTPEIKITSKHISDSEIQIEISDNGIGIEKDQLNNIFKLFYRIEKEQEGKGMGLYIVKTQVEQLGGNIVVNSEIDKGTSFTITLPQSNIFN